MIKFEVVCIEHRKLGGDIILPRRATSRSAGYDFYAPYDFEIPPFSEKLIWTDIKIKMPPDLVFDMIGRSSFGIKRNIIFKNIMPKIDADYYENKDNDGNIGLCFFNYGKIPQIIKKGEAFCQGTFYKYYITDDDCPVAFERSGGIGSTTK